MQQRFQGSDQRHVQRDTFLVGEAFGGFRQARRQHPRPPRRAKIIDCPCRTGLSQPHDGQRLSQLLSPVLKLRNHLRM